MDEEKKDEEKKEPEPEPTKDNDGGDKPDPLKPIVDANSAAKRMEDANKKREQLQKVDIELEARRAIAGNAEAGMSMEKKKPTDEEYAELMFKGLVDPLKDDGFK